MLFHICKGMTRALGAREVRQDRLHIATVLLFLFFREGMVVGHRLGYLVQVCPYPREKGLRGMKLAGGTLRFDGLSLPPLD